MTEFEQYMSMLKDSQVPNKDLVNKTYVAKKQPKQPQRRVDTGFLAVSSGFSSKLTAHLTPEIVKKLNQVAR